MKKHELRPATERRGVSAPQNSEYVEKLSRMINCKTVWTHEDTNKAEFEKFYATLEEIFPNIAKGTLKSLSVYISCQYTGKKHSKNIKNKNPPPRKPWLMASTVSSELQP